MSYFEFAKKMVDTKATSSAGGQVESNHRGVGPQPVRHEQGRVPSAVPHPDRSVCRRQWERTAVAEAARAGVGRIAADGQQGVNVLVASRPAASTAEEAAKLVSFLMTDPAAVKILKVERGVPAIAEVQSLIEPELDATGKMSLTFAQDLQDEVVPPPQVTPQNASGYSGEVTRIGTDVLFNRKTPADAAAGVAGGDQRKQQLSQSCSSKLVPPLSLSPANSEGLP